MENKFLIRSIFSLLSIFSALTSNALDNFMHVEESTVKSSEKQDLQKVNPSKQYLNQAYDNYDVETAGELHQAGEKSLIEGDYLNAVEFLQNALKVAENNNDTDLIIGIKSSLGNAYIYVRRYEEGRSLLNEGIRLAKRLGKNDIAASTLISLGNSHLITRKGEPSYLYTASNYYRDAYELIKQTDFIILKAKALTNYGFCESLSSHTEKAFDIIKKAYETSDQLPDSTTKSHLFTTIGQTLHIIAENKTGSSDDAIVKSNNAFLKSISCAAKIEDKRALTFALGYQGELYEFTEQLDDALSLARQASFIAQEYQVPSALYKWQWLIGCILRAQNNIDQSIKAYRQSLDTVNHIRHDLTSCLSYSEIKSSFRETVGPIFFQLADMLLLKSANEQSELRHAELLVDARNVMEEFKAGELEQYFVHTQWSPFCPQT